MSVPGQTVCPRCGTKIRADETFCPACLLDAVSTQGPDSEEERIFQQALELASEARLPFIREQTMGSPALLSAVEMLLKGFEEAGGDAADRPAEAATDQPEQWTAVTNEEPGTVIGHFRLVHLIGEGGMGSVWQAEQTAPVRRTVALKVIKLGMDTRDVVKRFARERQTLALLNHPGIAQVYEAGATTLGRPYFAMELVEGQPITAYCDAAGLGLESRLALFQEVCAAVEHAHQKGVIHRDLKPSNILVTGGAVKVIDFGVAKATQSVGETPLFTRQAQILGTPAYMSPEQARSAGVDIDTRTDVYALGVILYELLTGVLPIDSDRLAATDIVEMQRILLEEEPPTPSTRLAWVSAPKKSLPAATNQPFALRGDLDWVVMKAISKDRNERYASAAALAEDLRRYLTNEPVSAVPPTLSYHVRKFVRRNRASVASGAMIVVALLTGLIVSLFQVHRTNQALAGQAKAREEVTFTLSDMYARSFLSASEKDDSNRAELWFANAAILGANDPTRAEANRLRAMTWRSEAMTAVRAFDTGFEHLRRLKWNPRHPAMIAESEGVPVAQIWDLETERQWPPAAASKISRAAWDHAGDRIAMVATNGVVTVLEFPSGQSLAQLTNVSAACLEWSPDGHWIATGAFLWNWKSDERIALPQAAQRIRFNRAGSRLLLQWNSQAGICDWSDPVRFRFPPVPAHFGDFADFIGEGNSFAVGEPQGGITVRDASTGTVLFSETNGMSSDFDGLPITASGDGRFLARRDQATLALQNFAHTKFPLHQGQYVGAAFSPDSSLLASGGYDNRLELWSLADGKFLGEVGHHHTGVVNVEFSPDGQFVASGEDGLVRVWRVRRPEWVKKISAGAPTRAVISPDGKFVAASGYSNQAGDVRQTQLFAIATGQAAGPKIEPGGLLMDAAFSRDVAWLALAVSTTTNRSNAAFAHSGGSGNVQLWNPLTGERLGDPISLPSEPRGLCVHPAENLLGVCCAGGEAMEIDLARRTSRILFDDHRVLPADATLNNGRCAYSQDGRVFIVWGLQEQMHLWHRENGRDLVAPSECAGTAFDVALHDRIAASALVAPSMRIELRDLQTGREVAPAIPYINWPLLTRFSADGNLLLTAGGGKNAQVWDWRKGQLVCPMLPHDETIMAGCFVEGTPWVITGGHDGKIKFWDRRTGMMIRPPLQRNGWVLELQTTPDAHTLVAGGYLEGNIELMSLNELLPTPDLPAEDARLLSEIDADAEVHPGGGLAPLTPQAWLKKWREFRERQPYYAGHQLGK